MSATESGFTPRMPHSASDAKRRLAKLEPSNDQVPGKALEIAPLASKVTLDGIISTVASLSGIPVEVILSRNRTRAVADARHLAMFLAAEMFPDLSARELAPSFCRVQDAIGHGTRQTRARMDVDKQFAIWVKVVREKIKSG